MRLLLAGLTVATTLALASGALAQPSLPGQVSAGPPAPLPATSGERGERGVENDAHLETLEALHRESLATRRALADTVLVAGLVSLAGGAALVIPDGDDQAWRFAGINTALFGAVNTAVGLLALHGIGREERAWESGAARASRRSPGGLVRARMHAAIDERRESVGRAISLGLDCAYLGVAGTAILASQLDVDHEKRWLASGIAVGVQAAFLLGVDLIGLARSAHFHGAFVDGFSPSFAFVPASGAASYGSELRMGFGGAF